MSGAAGQIPEDSFIDSGRGSVPRTLLRLAGPIIASMISRTAMGFVDFLMVSQLGTEAQAAIMAAGILLFCVIGLGLGTVTSVNTFVSQSLGRGQLRECSAYAWQGLHVSWFVGVLLLPCWFGVEQGLRWTPHSPVVRRLMADYIQVGILGIGPAVAAAAMSNFFTGIHRPILGLLAAVVSNAFNVLANWVLIFGRWGFEPLGIRGAAWATLLASVLNFAILLVWMLLPHYARRFHGWRMWRPSLRRLRAMLWVGLPTGMQFTADVASWAIFVNFLVGRFGTVQLAANNIATQWLHVSFMPAVGLGIALTAAVGKSIGSGRRDLARRYVRWAMLFAVGYMGLVGTGFAVFRYPLVGLMTDDPVVIEWGVKLMICCAIFQVFDALGITFINALRGAGDTRVPAAISILYAGVVFLGGGYLVIRLFPQWQSVGPWGVATGYIVLFGLTMWARYAFGPWERIELLGSAHEHTAQVTTA